MSSLVLASQSPRRVLLLKQLNLDFLQMSPKIDEVKQTDESIDNYIQRMAIEKVMVGYQSYPNHIIIAADTCAVINDKILGKPQNLAESATMLTLLSGKTHIILTSFAIYDGNKLHNEVVASSVTIRDISPTEIKDYWQTGEPQDKAGSYAIQGLAAMFVKEIKGSYSAIMGLPLYELAKALSAYNIKFF